MKKELFNYTLPESLIAQSPLDKRDASKLLVMDKLTGDFSHHQFFNIIELLDENDVLVINNTKVIPARVVGYKESTEATIELLLLEEVGKDLWNALTKPQRRVKVGDRVIFDGLIAECVEVKKEGISMYKMLYEGTFLEVLSLIGTMPTPPYIHEELKDQGRYQTVYADLSGSSAAPTAGLHFTNELLKKIKEKGIEVIEITLHVGLGTFRTVTALDVENHHMHTEKYTISEEACKKLNAAVKNKKIVAVGTTSVRALESNYQNGFRSGFFETNIFIYPPYQFKVVDKIITNFHLPESTLLMLVSAFSKREYVLNAYKEAINKGYRFFSFGDAMLFK